eukprot:TRINITY_DN112674_c0_g1_i1.p1 TRINITY_DN112674_c0_g1~~TRINITY_DN112674_c0_g1_i1.p1  ORF type:complete len:393 (-),score=65.58 TRINITY_DN112674_c0_g1_i1:293-1471(-)
MGNVTKGRSLKTSCDDTLPIQDTIVKLSKTYGGCGGVILHVSKQNGDFTFSGSAGKVSHESHDMVDTSDVFPVASVTKMVTGVVILQLADEGLLALHDAWTSVGDGSVSKLMEENVPNWPKIFDDVTIRQLLQHTSGIPPYWPDEKAFKEDPERHWTKWDLLGYVADVQIKQVKNLPAKCADMPFDYSDANYLILGLVIEVLTGKRLNDAFRQRVFSPSGMSSKTYCAVLEDQPSEVSRVCMRYMGRKPIEGLTLLTADSFAGGGIVTNAEDLQKLMLAINTGRLFPGGGRATLEKMMCWKQMPCGMSYGLGLMRVELEEASCCARLFRKCPLEGHLWGHVGFGGAFAFVWERPDHPEDVTIIVGTTSNEACESGQERLVREAVRTVLTKGA